MKRDEQAARALEPGTEPRTEDARAEALREALGAVLRGITEDARREPARYLSDAEVPAGGE